NNNKISSNICVVTNANYLTMSDRCLQIHCGEDVRLPLFVALSRIQLTVCLGPSSSTIFTEKTLRGGQGLPCSLPPLSNVREDS
ncbi:hypothetical protein TNCV_1350501, partial [Trichonephila clavipes]